MSKILLGVLAAPRVRVVDRASEEITSPASAPAGSVMAFSIAHERNIVAAGHNLSPMVTVYNQADLSLVSGTPVIGGGTAYSVAFSPDESVLAVGTDYGTWLYLFDTTDWSPISFSNAPTSTVRGVAFSPITDVCVVAQNGAPYLKVFDTITWAQIATPSTSPSTACRDAAISPDGQWLVVTFASNGAVGRFSTTDWSRQALPSVAGVGGAKVAFSPDGTRFAVTFTSSLPGYRVYNTADGTELSGLPPAPAPNVYAVTWLDDNTLALGMTASPYVVVIDLVGKTIIETYPAIATNTFAIAGLPGVQAGKVTLPLTIDVLDPAGRIVLPLRVQVAQPGSVTLPLSLDVLDPAVLAGLDGAGGWAAAPDGLWAAVVLLDGADISARIQGTVRVEREDDAAATATFSFLPAGPIAAMGLIGRTVRIAFAQAAGINVQAMFSGVVAVPSIDAATGLVSCECTDQMPEVFAAADRAWIDSAIGGRYHVAVSGEPTDNWEYALERLQSVPRSIALDVQQRPVVLPWRDMPRTMTIRTPDMIDETLQVALPDRDSMRTRITVRMQYRYWRLRGRGAVAAWAQPFAFFASYDLVTGFRGRQWMLASMVEGASERLPGWSLRGSVAIEHPAPGVYFTNPPNFAGYWIPPDVAPDLVSGFRAYYAARWAQVVTETYEITLVAPQLEAALGGPIAEEMGANLDAGDLPEGWAADETVQPVLVIPAVGDVSLAWQPAEGDTTQRDEVLRTLLDRAWVRRWSASRSGRVSFGMALRPDIWLDVWAEVVHDADDMDVTLNAAGKVTRIEHELDAETGVARTHVEVAVGMPGNVAASLPEWELPAVEMPDETRPLTTWSLDVPTFVGGEGGSPAWDPEAMIGFVTNTNRSYTPEEDTYHYYPHQLALRAPDIDALDRDPLEVLVQAQIEGESPTDLLEIDPS